MMRMIGLGNAIASATIAAEPDEPHPRCERRHRPAAVERDHRQQVEEVQQEAGERQRRAEVVAAWRRRSEAGRRADAPEHRAGEADARLGERVAAERRAQMTAPRNGMNIGAEALTPSRRNAITCPISWTKSSTTKPTANASPRSARRRRPRRASSPQVVSSLSFGSSSRIVLSFAPMRPSAASRLPPARFHHRRGRAEVAGALRRRTLGGDRGGSPRPGAGWAAIGYCSIEDRVRRCSSTSVTAPVRRASRHRRSRIVGPARGRPRPTMFGS